MGVISIVNGDYKPTYNWGAPHCKIIIRWKPPNGPHIVHIVRHDQRNLRSGKAHL